MVYLYVWDGHMSRELLEVMGAKCKYCGQPTTYVYDGQWLCKAHLSITLKADGERQEEIERMLE